MNDIAALHISKAFASILKVYASFTIVKGFNIIYTACKNIKIPRWDITFLRFYYSIFHWQSLRIRDERFTFML